MSDNKQTDEPSGFRKYLRGLFHLDEKQERIENVVRARVKWVLDILRNIMVVGAIYFVAKITDSIVLRAMSLLGTSALLVYLMSYLEPLEFRPFHFLKDQKWGRRLDFAVTMLLILPLGLLIMVAVMQSVDVISSAYLGK